MKVYFPALVLLFIDATHGNGGLRASHKINYERKLNLDPNSQLVYLDTDGVTLIYDQYVNENGPTDNDINDSCTNTVPDFSNVGYMGKSRTILSYTFGMLLLRPLTKPFCSFVASFVRS